MAWFKCTGGSGGSLKLRTASGKIATFETNLSDELQSLKCEINASGGGGTPSTPIPLVGHSELNLTRCGVNLFDELMESGSIDNTTGQNETYGTNRMRSINYIPVIASEDYCVFNNSGISLIFYFYASDKSYLSYRFIGNNTTTLLTLPNNCSFVRFRTDNNYGTTYNNDISILYPSDTTPAYHAYNGQTFTVAFGQTVYGGVYDKSGRLTITHAGTTLNGSEAIDVTDAGQSTQMFIVPAVGVPVVSTIGYDSTDLLCNAYTACAWSDNPWYVNNSISFYVYDGTLRIKDDACADVAAFKAYLANNPVTIVYPLATPIVIDVPSISVFAENGTNNIVSDGGGDVDVSYLELIRGT